MQAFHFINVRVLNYAEIKSDDNNSKLSIKYFLRCIKKLLDN